jgi:hypothetical protein
LKGGRATRWQVADEMDASLTHFWFGRRVENSQAPQNPTQAFTIIIPSIPGNLAACS